MSGQGSGSIARYSFERQLLDNWASWARAGGAGQGYTSMPWLHRSGPKLLFGDETMLQVDRTIASLPRDHKRTLKKVFLSRRGLLLPAQRKESAIAAFSMAWSDPDGGVTAY